MSHLEILIFSISLIFIPAAAIPEVRRWVAGTQNTLGSLGEMGDRTLLLVH